MLVSKRLSRRGFLKTTVAAGAAATLPARNVARAAGANERITTAYIGCGHIAKQGHLKELAPTLLKDGKLNILAACDVYKTRAKEFQDSAKRRQHSTAAIRYWH